MQKLKLFNLKPDKRVKSDQVTHYASVPAADARRYVTREDHEHRK